MPRPSNRAQRREEIANALMRIMAKKGYEGAALSDVAAEAGLTQGLIHYHFKDKMEILLEAQRMLMTRHMVALGAAVHSAGFRQAGGGVH